jgi:hypothetical protein
MASSTEERTKQMIDVKAETARIEAEVKNVITNAGGNTDNIYFSVREILSGKAGGWSSRNPTGMFTIDLWSLKSRTNPRSRAHMFRTTKTGVVPGDKISEYVTYQIAVRRETAARKAKLEAVQADNEAAAESLRNNRKAASDCYYSSHPTQCNAFITASSGIVGKVKIGLPALYLTEDQAKQLFALLDSFK